MLCQINYSVKTNRLPLPSGKGWLSVSEAGDGWSVKPSLSEANPIGKVRKAVGLPVCPIFPPLGGLGRGDVNLFILLKEYLFSST